MNSGTLIWNICQSKRALGKVCAIFQKILTIYRKFFYNIQKGDTQMDKNDPKFDSIDQIIAIARMYYEGGLTQNEISRRVNLSCSTISRMLKKAKERGFVQTVVVDPFASSNNLQTQLKKMFGLKDTLVVNAYSSNPRTTKSLVCGAAADYIAELVKPGDILGIAPSTTTAELAKAMRPREMEKLTAISISGCTYEHVIDEDVFSATRIIGKKLGAEIHFLYTPIIVSSTRIKEVYLSDSNTKMTMQMIEACNITVNSVGYLGRHSQFYRYGYMDEATMTGLEKRRAVGCLCAHYYDINGIPVDRSLSERVIGITLEQLRAKEYSICVASGQEKVMALLGALRGGYVNVLIVDDATAKSILIEDSALEQPSR